MNYLIVILDHHAPSFCCYHTQRKNDGNPLMPLEVLQRVVDFAIRHRLSLNFLYGHDALPRAYEQLIETTAHIKLMPLAQAGSPDDAVFIIDAGSDLAHLDKLDEGDLNNLILRVGKRDLHSIVATSERLIGKFKRLNVILEDIATFDAAAFSLYEVQLAGLRQLVEDEYRKGNLIEVSVVSDRMFLTNMNNCNAGVDHVTVAPNGRLYLCPAFYYDNEDDSIGELGAEIAIGNGRLLELDRAPICRNCDAYQCKRCIYLNKKLTSEHNTPSHQQCVGAHLERNASRQLRIRLGTDFFAEDRPPQIPAIDYLDPFDLISDRSLDGQARQRHFAGLLAKPLEQVPVHELLAQIHALDPGMLTQLKVLNHGLIEPDLPVE